MKKYKFTDNLGLKIIAVIFAAFLWLIVVNLDNPVSTQTFSEVPVTIINEDIILSAGDTYQVLGEEKVSVVSELRLIYPLKILLSISGLAKSRQRI